MTALPVLLLSLVAFSTACEKKHNITLNDSGIEYVYKLSESPGVVASFDGEDIPDLQINGSSAVMQDLENRESEILVSLAYQFAEEKFRDDLAAGKKVKFVIFRKDPKKPIAQILASLNLMPHKNIEVSWTNPGEDPNLVAEANGQKILATDLKLNNFRYYSIKKKQFEERLRRLQGIVVRRALSKAASGTKTPIEEYLKSKIGTDTGATDQEIQEFAKANNISESDINDEMKKKLKDIVSEKKRNTKIEKFVGDELIKKPIVIHFRPPEAVFSVNPSMAITWGYATAPIQIAVFSDFLCGPCVSLGKQLMKLREEYKGQLKISFNHFFSESDRNSRMLAEASMCAYNQKNEYFGKFIDEYIANQLPPDEETIYKTAEKVGANLDEFKKCFLARTYQNLVDDHLKYARGAGVTIQPTLVVDDEILEGMISDQGLENLLKTKVREKGDPWYKVLWRKLFG
jgi:protein-disulfide isomerase